MCIRDSPEAVFAALPDGISTPETVSYTHLDVYKRQRQYIVRQRDGGGRSGGG